MARSRIVNMGTSSKRGSGNLSNGNFEIVPKPRNRSQRFCELHSTYLTFEAISKLPLELVPGHVYHP